MILYHTIKAFLWTLFQLPFFILAVILGLIHAMIPFADDIDFNQLNPFKTYHIVKKNMASGDFHKWSGKRIKK